MSDALQEAKQRAAAELAAEMFGGEVAEAQPEVPSDTAEPAPEAEEQDTVVDLEFAPVDLEELGLDFEDEPTSEVEEQEDDDEIYLDDESETAKERQARIKAEKRAKFLEDQLVETKTKSWKKEAARRFPLADVDEINATSKRSFMKAAATDHNRAYARLEPHLKAIAEEKAKLRAEVEGEVREETAAAWGKPMPGPGIGAVRQGETDARIAAARRQGYGAVVREMLKDPKLNPFAK